MRKNSIRKLIHGILDLLPLFVIPIFAININQKSVEPISIEVQEKISVDFNQNINNQQTFIKYNCDYVTINGTFEVTPTSNNSGIYAQYITNTIDHIYIMSAYWQTTENIQVTYYWYGGLPYYQYVNGNSLVQYRFKSIYNSSQNWQAFFRAQQNDTLSTYNISNMQLFDLTQMFGEGNEPTIEEFNIMFPNSYYTYTQSEEMLVNKPTPTTYDDTDIGSQFLYSLYISTDNYFNMNNVFNLNSVYSWFEMNIFGGSAPLSIYIVWNIIIYELVMDLLMLLYALFMFFIDACQKLIDKPLESIK